MWVETFTDGMSVVVSGVVAIVGGPVVLLDIAV